MFMPWEKGDVQSVQSPLVLAKTRKHSLNYFRGSAAQVKFVCASIIEYSWKYQL